MGVEFAGFDCEAPDTLASECRRTGISLSPWFGVANRYVCPIGLRPGYAHVLLKGGELDQLTFSKRYTLKFTANPANLPQEIIEFKNFRIVGTPICITPGYRGDPAATFFVELADRRIDCVGLCGKRYNWRIHPDSPYESASLYSGSAYTWTQILTDLWNAVGNLGTFPTLPTVPVGTPEQIDGMGCKAADLLDDLLLLNGMAAAYDPVTDLFSIVEFAKNANNSGWAGLVDIGLQSVGAALQKYDGRRLWDQEPIVDDLPKLPNYARVAFPVWSPGGAIIDTASYYVVDVADTAPDSTRLNATSAALIQDFLPLRTNIIGTGLNTSALVTRAAAVAAIFFKVAHRASFLPIYRAFSGVINDPKILPGAAIDIVSWEDVGAGPITRVIQTGRLGFGPLFGAGAAYTTGSIVTGHPYGAATNFYRSPLGSTSQLEPIQRVANIPPGELREYEQGPFVTAGKSQAANLAGGGGMSSIMERTGPLRQWDAAVQARSVDGHGQRLWMAKPRSYHMCFVKITSVTPSGSNYPAIEQFIDPITKVISNGSACWYYEPNTSSAPILNSIHWCFLDGTDGSNVKVYVDSIASAGGGIDVAGRTGSVVDVTGTLTLANGAVTGTTPNVTWTPDVASSSLSGIVNLSAQTLGDGDKSFQASLLINIAKTSGKLLKVWGTGATDPVLLTGDASVQIGGVANSATLTVRGATDLRSTLDTYGISTFHQDTTVNPNWDPNIHLRAWGSGTTDPVFITNSTGVQMGGTTNGATLSAYGQISAIGGKILQQFNDRAWMRAEKTGTLGVNKLATFDFMSNTDVDGIGVAWNQIASNFTDKDGTVYPGIVLKFKHNTAGSDVLMLNESGGAPYGHGGNVGFTGTGGGGDSYSGGICYAAGTPGSIVNLAVSGSTAFTGVITPSQITVDTNDWAPTGL